MHRADSRDSRVLRKKWSDSRQPAEYLVYWTTIPVIYTALVIKGTAGAGAGCCWGLGPPGGWMAMAGKAAGAGARGSMS